MPVVLGQTIATIQPEDIARIAGFLAFAVVIIALVVFMNEATRQIPINYSRRAKNSTVASSYLPLRLNQAGVIPIIFAVSLVLLPQFLGQFLAAADNAKLADIGNVLLNLFDPSNIMYSAFYFFLVVGFTYFYTAVVFNPEKIAENLQKSGGYIPGIRPGKQTEKYLAKVLNRITLVGAVFLGFIAVLPALLQNVIGLSNLAIGGTGILIVVSVILEVTRDLEAQLVMRKYDSFIR
jgi:preprotein translocase subunit SecY